MGLPIILWLIFKTFITLNRQKICMSSFTFELHKQLLHSLIFQLLVPSLTIFVPFVGLTIILLIGANNVISWGQSFYIISTYHSLFNTLMMIYFIKPYRRAITSRRQQQTSITPMASTSITISTKRKNLSSSYISKF
uniref:Uncharacterized protein n=1 Tax=Panagrolaimus sp. PS1159 TaxID=55785 RepID=A0AC35GN58_9BILA